MTSARCWRHVFRARPTARACVRSSSEVEGCIGRFPARIRCADALRQRARSSCEPPRALMTHERGRCGAPRSHRFHVNRAHSGKRSGTDRMHDFRASFREWFEKLPARLSVCSANRSPARNLCQQLRGEGGAIRKRHGNGEPSTPLRPHQNPPRCDVDRGACASGAAAGSRSLPRAAVRRRRFPIAGGSAFRQRLCYVLSPRFSTVKIRKSESPAKAPPGEGSASAGLSE